MKGWEQWRDVYSPEGQLLFAGLRAKVSVFHGQMTRIVPHTTTGHLLSLLHLAQLADVSSIATCFLHLWTKQQLQHVVCKEGWMVTLRKLHFVLCSQQLLHPRM